MNVTNQRHKKNFTLHGFCILNFLLPHFAFFAFSLFIGSSLFCIYLEDSNLDVGFFLLSFIMLTQSQSKYGW